MNAPASLIPWQGSEHPPRDWQAEALPLIIAGLKRGEKGLVCAVMGSGKSILQAEIAWLATRNLKGRVIIFCVPSQRLVQQLSETLAKRIGKSRVGVYYGKKKQIRDVIVACNPSLPALHVELAARGRVVALVAVDEAHRSEAAQVRETVPDIHAACLVGFTATPFRSIPKQTISLFDSVLYRYTISDAITDKVLVPPRVERWRGQMGTPIDQACLSMLREHCTDLGPGIVSANDIADAEEHATWLSDAGWASEAIHSRISRTEQDARLERLRTGEIRCLVHVSLLTEGVDLPWLMWICLRRPVQASVRFLQEVGRVLRVFPGKTEAVVLDPHLLLGRHGWETAEAIGQALEEAAEEEAEQDAAEPKAFTEPREHEALALDVLLAYLGRARKDMEEAGICEAPRYESGGWQLAPVSRKQVEAIKGSSKLTRHIPGECRDPIKALAKVPWVLTRGQAADLLDVLKGGWKWARVEAGRLGLSQPWRLQWSAGSLKVGGEAPSVEECNNVAKWGARMSRAVAKMET